MCFIADRFQVSFGLCSEQLGNPLTPPHFMTQGEQLEWIS